ncbi:MAG: 50S ribosomal protein L11 methyltransferase [Desulfobacterium sp.]|nr:50S ribosomal protein L11 methyltransferase [Desulfobacterium sp.]
MPPCDGPGGAQINPGVIKRALEIVTESEIRITPRDFARCLAKDAGISTKEAKKVLKHLVDLNELSYSYELGATQVEPSFARPVRVTDHFVLSPWTTDQAPPLIEVLLLPGISFGSGKHPTTRLCLEAIDLVLLGPGFQEPCPQVPADVSPPAPSERTCPRHYARAADVGTGSGVLALAMVRAGCDFCLALDTDLNSASEAMQNVVLNGLERQIEVTTDLLAPSHGTFDLIAANLRFPTLKNLAPLFQTLLDNLGCLIFSGIKPYELQGLTQHYSDHGFIPVWTKDEKEWSALVLKKTWKP